MGTKLDCKCSYMREENQENPDEDSMESQSPQFNLQSRGQHDSMPSVGCTPDGPLDDPLSDNDGDDGMTHSVTTTEALYTLQARSELEERLREVIRVEELQEEALGRSDRPVDGLEGAVCVAPPVQSRAVFLEKLNQEMLADTPEVSPANAHHR